MTRITGSVRPYMNRSICCLAPTETVDDALKFLAALDLSTAPVVDDRGIPIGLVSIKDLIDAPGTNAVFSVMSKPCLSVRDSASIADAIRVLLSREIHHLCVVDAEGTAVGFLGSLDLLSGCLGATQPSARPSRPLVDRILSLGTEIDISRDETEPEPSIIMLTRAESTRIEILWLEATRTPRARIRSLGRPDGHPRLRTAVQTGGASWIVTPLEHLLDAREQSAPEALGPGHSPEA